MYVVYQLLNNYEMCSCREINHQEYDSLDKLLKDYPTAKLEDPKDNYAPSGQYYWYYREVNIPHQMYGNTSDEIRALLQYLYNNSGTEPIGNLIKKVANRYDVEIDDDCSKDISIDDEKYADWIDRRK